LQQRSISPASLSTRALALSFGRWRRGGDGLNEWSFREFLEWNSVSITLEV
jgi:hypothetical protein